MKTHLITLITVSSLLLYNLTSAQTKSRDYLTDNTYSYISEKDTNITYHIQNLSYDFGQKPIHSGPRISSDGKTMYFFIDEIKDTCNTSNQEIYKTTMVNGKWNNPEAVDHLNNRDHNGVHFISQDGKRLLVLGEYLKNNTSIDGLSTTCKYLHKDKWHAPHALKVKNFENNAMSSFYMNKEEDVLLLAITGQNPVGKQDLYVSFKKKRNKWTEPINLGTKINTTENEGSMYLSEDSKTLYFSSNGHKNSLGGFDIYKTTRLDDTWLNWSTPENIGKPYNTEHDDMYFSTIEGSNTAFLSRDYLCSDGFKHCDIFSIEKNIFQPDTCLELYVNLIDFSTKKSINTEVLLISDNETITLENMLENNSVKLDHDTYEIMVADDRYLKYDQMYRSDCKLTKTDTIDIYLKPKKKNVSWEIENIFFAFDSDVLLPTSYPALENIKKVLTLDSDLIVEISGHTDTRGNDVYNKRLSQLRANSVVNYLIDHGIEKSRLKAKGYGETQLRNGCTDGVACSEKQHQQNRRVEFKILEIKDSMSYRD